MEDNWRHSWATRTFLTCNVLKESGFIQEMNYLINYAPLCREFLWLVSIHHLHTQNFPCDRKRTMVGSQQEGYPHHSHWIFWIKKKRNTTTNENNDGEIKLELIKIIIIATLVALKMTMAEIMGGDDNDSTNERVKNLSFSKRRRQQLQNINNSLRSNNALLFNLELNRRGEAKVNRTPKWIEFKRTFFAYGMWPENWNIFGEVMSLN